MKILQIFKKYVRFLCIFLLILNSELVYTKKSYSYQHFRQQFSYPIDELDELHNEFHDSARLLCLVMGICPIHHAVTAHKPALASVYEWSQLEFDYASESDRQRDVDNKIFIPGKPAPIDVDVYYGPNNNNKVFVTIPRFQEGVPITLGTVTANTLDGNPIIAPYPSWKWHKNPHRCNRDRIVSVYRVKIDECGRLWVLDTGRLLEEQTCPPQILAFDLETNELLHRYAIPSSQLESRSILVTPVVDVRDSHHKCRDTFVYVADCQTFSIIVYDVKREKSWRVTDKTLYPFPNFGTFDIQGDSFDLMDGVLGMAIEPYKPGQDRKLFFHAMSSPTENWVYTSYLRNQSRFIDDPQSSPEIFHTYDGQRPSQSAAEAIDSNGIAYFGLMSETSINCWDTDSEYGPTNIDVIAKDPVTLQFNSGIKVITNRKGVEELWLLTSRFQKVATGTLKTDEINFRIQAAKVNDLVFNTKCRGRATIHSSPGSSSGSRYGARPVSSSGLSAYGEHDNTDLKRDTDPVYFSEYY